MARVCNVSVTGALSDTTNRSITDWRHCDPYKYN